MAIPMTKVASVPHHELMIADADDILIVVPEEGFKDTVETARLSVAALRDYASKLGKKCGLVIVANNLLSQDAESRRVYAQGVTNDLFFSVTMVVSSPLARSIGSVAVRFTKMPIPFGLSDSIESGITWSEGNRKA